MHTNARNIFALLWTTSPKMFARPNPKLAMKEARSNMLMFASVVVAARLSVYMMHLYQKGSRN